MVRPMLAGNCWPNDEKEQMHTDFTYYIYIIHIMCINISYICKIFIDTYIYILQLS